MGTGELERRRRSEKVGCIVLSCISHFSRHQRIRIITCLAIFLAPKATAKMMMEKMKKMIMDYVLLTSALLCTRTDNIFLGYVFLTSARRCTRTDKVTKPHARRLECNPSQGAIGYSVRLCLSLC